MRGYGPNAVRSSRRDRDDDRRDRDDDRRDRRGGRRYETRLNEHEDCDHHRHDDDYEDCRKETRSGASNLGPHLAVAAAGLLYSYLL